MLSRDMTLGQALRDVASSRLPQEALVCEGARMSYGALLARVSSLACGLRDRGLGKDDRIAIALSPGPEFACLFFAAAELGAVVVPLNPLTRDRQLQEVLHDAQPGALVTAHPVDPIVLRSLPTLRLRLQIGDCVQPTEPLEALMAAPVTTMPDLDAPAPQDMLVLLYTSGTSGQPKGAMHSHRSLIAPVLASSKLRDLWIRRPGLKQVGEMAKAVARYGDRLLRAAGKPQTFLSTTGWHTITGLEVMLQALLMGDRLVVMPRFHPREAMELVQREHVTILVAVPTVFEILLGLEGFEEYDTSSLLICGTGAAPCAPHLAREMQRRFGCAVHIGFGATETAGGIAATSLADSDERQAETVGRPMPGMEVRIVDEQRKPLPPGEVGELACRSDSVMLGYLGAPETSSEVVDKEGWYYTGDLGMLDAKGYLRIVGRKKDVILRAGQTIYPAEIESVLVQHPKIREAAVVGVPSHLEGESAWAFILLREEMEMTAREVKDLCRLQLEASKIPRHVRFVTELPRSETGKPQKFILRELALAEQEGAEPK